jgi:hypothetical protein
MSDRKTKQSGEIQPLLVRPRPARRMLADCGQKQLYELINAGEIDSFKEGRARKIVVASIHSYIARKLKA